MEELVDNLRKAMELNLAELAWMTPATRATAKAKLDAFRVKIGYPDKFKTYDGHGHPRRRPARQRAWPRRSWQAREDLDGTAQAGRSRKMAT